MEGLLTRTGPVPEVWAALSSTTPGWRRSTRRPGGVRSDVDVASALAPAPGFWSTLCGSLTGVTGVDLQETGREISRGWK